MVMFSSKPNAQVNIQDPDMYVCTIFQQHTIYNSNKGFEKILGKADMYNFQIKTCILVSRERDKSVAFNSDDDSILHDLTFSKNEKNTAETSTSGP